MHAWTLLVATAIKGSLILGVAWALAARPGRWSAAARHQVLAAALAAALLLPLGTVMLPAWRWYVPGAEALLTQAPPSARATILSMAPTAPSSRTRPQEPSAAVFEARTAMSTASARSRTIEWPLALIAFWILGTAVLSLRLTIGIVGAWRIGRKAVVVTDPSWLASREGAARRLNLTQRVEVRMTDGAMPSTCGLWRAFLLLPTDAHTWDDQRRSVVLLHEMAHIRRRDCQTQIMAQLACALYWFNPLVWIAAARLRVERELACDDLVLSAGTRSSDYATHLLDIARQFRNPVLPSVATVSMARPSQLEGRLLAILDGTRSRRQPTARRSTLGLLAAAALLLPMAAVQPAARPIDNLASLQRVDFSAGAPGSITGELRSVATIVGRRPLEADARQTDTPAPVSQPQPSTSDRSDQQRRIVDALVTALADENADVRQQAASTLARIRDPRAIDGLTVALKDRDADVRQEAVSGLASLRMPETSGPLLLALKDEDSDVRAKAAFALGQLRDPKVADALMAALEDVDAEVRQSAASALAQLEDPRSADALIGALGDAEADVRQQAAFGLAQLRTQAAVLPLINALNDSEADVRQQAAFALSGLRDPRSIDGLIRALQDRAPEVRQQAAFALSQLRSTAAVEPLIGALKDRAGEVRQQAAFALGQIRDPRAVDALTEALKDDDEDVRQQAAFALGQLMGKSANRNINRNTNHNINR